MHAPEASCLTTWKLRHLYQTEAASFYNNMHVMNAIFSVPTVCTLSFLLSASILLRLLIVFDRIKSMQWRQLTANEVNTL